MLRKFGFSRWKRRQRVAHSVSYGLIEKVAFKPVTTGDRDSILSLSTIAFHSNLLIPIARTMGYTLTPATQAKKM